jgi:L-alanine-DL-glutamate epimerase-like enolase superfamily enzyme
MADHSIQPIGVDSRDVIVPDVRVAADGTAKVPTCPGLGLAVDLDYIENCTETVERIERKK